jgi:hypothetical protein
VRTYCALHTHEAPHARRFTTSSRILMLRRSIFTKPGLLNSVWRSLFHGPAFAWTRSPPDQPLVL